MNWIYVRISTSHQSDESLERQEEICRQWVSEPITVVSEVGSGKNQDRPKLQEMLKQLQSGDYICIRDNSRLARNMLGSLVILNTITEKGAHLICDGKVIDPDNCQDMFTYHVHSAFSDMQRSIQNQKSSEAIRKVYEFGDYVFCSTLFGYSLTKHGKNKTIEIVEEEAKIIRFIFDKFSSGWSIKKILSNLTGVVLQRQSTFTLKKISRILHQPIYAGFYIKDRGKLENPGQIPRSELESILIKSNVYPPIISEDLFWSCFERYRILPVTNARPFQLRWTKHTLSGIIHCPDCGKGMSRFEKQGGIYGLEDHTFDCPTKNRAKFQGDWLETIMEFCFYLTFLSGDEIGSFFSERQQELYQNKTELTEVLSDIDRSISETQTKIGRIVSAIADGIITNEQASSQMRNMKQTISDLEARKTSLERDLRQIEVDVDSLIELSSSEIIDSFCNQKRDYYKKFLKYGYAYNDRIEIEYMNGKHYTIPRGKRHNHKIDPITIVSIYNNDVYSFVYELNNVSLVKSECEPYDDYVEGLLKKAWELTNDNQIE